MTNTFEPNSTLADPAIQVATTQSARLDSLTGLRTAAAVAVFGHHIGYLFHKSDAYPLIDRATRQGAVGVDLFFVLSGFVLAWSYLDPTRAAPVSVRRFWRRRAARIAPVYFLCVGLAMFVISIEPGPDKAGSYARCAFNLTLVQAWVPNEKWFSGGNGVGWSLSAEAFFYLMFPLLIRVTSRMSARSLRTLLAALLSAAALVPVLVHPSDHAVLVQSGWRYWLVYISPATRLLEFAVGVTVASWIRRGGRVRVSPTVATMLAVISYVVAGFVPLGLSFVPVTIAPFTLLIASLAYRDSDRNEGCAKPRSLWTSSLMLRLGICSYCFYLVHQLVLRTSAAIVITNSMGYTSRGLILVADLVLAWLIAYLLWRFVERPAEVRFREPNGNRTHGHKL